MSSKSMQAMIIVAAFVVGSLLGYSMSARSGIEPGYFEAAEAGSYGVAEESSSDTGLSTEDEDYYKSLSDGG